MNDTTATYGCFLYTGFAGLCDSLTGLGLLLAPAWILKQMGLRRYPQPESLSAFIGVFVFSTGVAYLYAASLPRKASHAPRWQTVWLLTAMTRSFVAIFLTWQMLTGQMESAWISVAVTDGAFASIQWIGLWRHWLRFPN